MVKVEDAALHAYLVLAAGLRNGPGVSMDMQSDIAELSSEATEKGFKSLALALLIIGNALDPTVKAKYVANNCASTAEFVTDPKERDILLRAAEVLRRNA